MSSIRNAPEKPVWLGASSVVRRFDISRTTLERWTRDEFLGFPKATRIGYARFWKLEELEAFERHCAEITWSQRHDLKKAAGVNPTTDAWGGRRRLARRPRPRAKPMTDIPVSKPRWLSRRQVAARYSVTTVTLDIWRHRPSFTFPEPAKRDGASVYWDSHELDIYDEWVRRCGEKRTAAAAAGSTAAAERPFEEYLAKGKLDQPRGDLATMTTGRSASRDQSQTTEE